MKRTKSSLPPEKEKPADSWSSVAFEEEQKGDPRWSHNGLRIGAFTHGPYMKGGIMRAREPTLAQEDIDEFTQEMSESFSEFSETMVDNFEMNPTGRHQKSVLGVENSFPAFGTIARVRPWSSADPDERGYADDIVGKSGTYNHGMLSLWLNYPDKKSSLMNDFWIYLPSSKENRRDQIDEKVVSLNNGSYTVQKLIETTAREEKNLMSADLPYGKDIERIDADLITEENKGETKSGVYSEFSPFTVYPTTQKVDTRASGRYASVRIENDGAGENWRFGTFQVDLQPDRRR